MASPFLDALKERPLLCDGGMGTLLYSRGAPHEGAFEQLNLSRQEMIQQVHIDYINAGAEVIETNSFSANKFRLAAYGLEDQVWKINVWAAKVARNAREVAGQPTFVAGSVGPTGKLLPPFGDTKAQDLEDAFREQMEALLAGGVDLFTIETMSSLEETAIAVRAARKVSKLPVVAQMSFSTEAQTLLGVRPEDMVRLLVELGDDRPDVIGINCGAGPAAVIDNFSRLTSAINASGMDPGKIMFSAMPNAGLPSFLGGRYVYVSRPDYCASFVSPFVISGARLIGGCCGTTPDHIRLMRQSLDQHMHSHKTKLGEAKIVDIVSSAGDPGSIANISSEIGRGDAAVGSGAAGVVGSVAGAGAGSRVELPGVADPVAQLRPPDEGIKNKLVTGAKDKYFISVELDPPKGTVAKKIIRQANELYECGADAINVGDSPMARVRMSSLATCHLIRNGVGIETIIHFTTRDRNLMGIQADLLGCNALGIRNILALTGDPPSVGNYAHATAVYDVDSIGLIKIIGQLNEGKDIAGNSIGTPTQLNIGCALNLTIESRAIEKERLAKKIEAGADFIMTQPIYQLSDFTDFIEVFGEIPLPVLIGIMPLHSFKHAEYLHNEVPGISIPEPIRKAMEKAGDDGSKVGIELAEELLEQIRPYSAGVYMVPSFGRHEDIGMLVKKVKSSLVTSKA